MGICCLLIRLNVFISWHTLLALVFISHTLSAPCTIQSFLPFSFERSPESLLPRASADRCHTTVLRACRFVSVFPWAVPSCSNSGGKERRRLYAAWKGRSLCRHPRRVSNAGQLLSYDCDDTEHSAARFRDWGQSRISHRTSFSVEDRRRTEIRSLCVLPGRRIKATWYADAGIKTHYL
jgi:hypothetical protein